MLKVLFAFLVLFLMGCSPESNSSIKENIEEKNILNYPLLGMYNINISENKRLQTDEYLQDFNISSNANYSIYNVSFFPSNRAEQKNDFEINSISGEISLQYKTDYEENRSYTLDILVTENNSESIIRVFIHIKNLNDEVPVINNSSEISVFEGVSFAFSIDASDPDGEELSYALAGIDQQHFKLESNKVYFINPPDYEEQKEFFLTLSVSDGDFNVTKEIRISIEDKKYVIKDEIELLNYYFPLRYGIDSSGDYISVANPVRKNGGICSGFSVFKVEQKSINNLADISNCSGGFATSLDMYNEYISVLSPNDKGVNLYKIFDDNNISLISEIRVNEKIQTPLISSKVKISMDNNYIAFLSGYSFEQDILHVYKRLSDDYNDTKLIAKIELGEGSVSSSLSKTLQVYDNLIFVGEPETKAWGGDKQEIGRVKVYKINSDNFNDYSLVSTISSGIYSFGISISVDDDYLLVGEYDFHQNGYDESINIYKFNDENGFTYSFINKLSSKDTTTLNQVGLYGKIYGNLIGVSSKQYGTYLYEFDKPSGQIRYLEKLDPYSNTGYSIVIDKHILLDKYKNDEFILDGFLLLTKENQ